MRAFVNGCGIAAVLLITAYGMGAAAGQEAEPSAVIEGGDTPAENGDADPGAQPTPAEELPASTEIALTDPVAPAKAEPEAGPRDNYPGCEFNVIQECDLAAQQGMAESTLWMNRAAWAGLFLTALGLTLLLKTMLYTRDAAAYAKAAAAAADKPLMKPEKRPSLPKTRLMPHGRSGLRRPKPI